MKTRKYRGWSNLSFAKGLISPSLESEEPMPSYAKLYEDRLLLDALVKCLEANLAHMEGEQLFAPFYKEAREFLRRARTTRDFVILELSPKPAA